MRQNDLASHKHQVIDAHSCPIPAASIASHPQLGTYFARLVEEEPDLFAFLYPAPAPGRIRSIIEHEWYHHFSLLDGRARDNKILSRKLCLLCLSL